MKAEAKHDFSLAEEGGGLEWLVVGTRWRRTASVFFLLSFSAMAMNPRVETQGPTFAIGRCR